jgi:glucose-6-phosphate 1-epimerase
VSEPSAPDRTGQTLSAEAEGVRITACARGAHLMSWVADGVERLWMSPLSACGGEAPIRGGVPVLFPQFGAFGPLAKHGFARSVDWSPVVVDPTPEQAVLAFELVDSEATRAAWPHPFRLRLEVTAARDELRMTLRLDNLGDQPLRFTGGLHTYLPVADPQAWIEGLSAARAWDGDSTERPQFPVRLGDRVPALDPQDLVIRGVVAPLVLHDAVLGALRVAADGFPNRIVWNPGPDHGLPDVPPGGERGFVCIEPVAVVPIVVPPGGTWAGEQRLLLG